MHSSKTTAGFTLIELMIVVAIIAILAGIAYPSYRETVARSRRGDAKAVLLENQQMLERQYTLSSAYNKKGDGSNVTSPPLTEAPKDGAAKHYDVAFVTSTLTASGYTLKAVPKNGMSGDKCGTLTLTHAGVKGVTGGTADVSTCWGK